MFFSLLPSYILHVTCYSLWKCWSTDPIPSRYPFMGHISCRRRCIAWFPCLHICQLSSNSKFSSQTSLIFFLPYIYKLYPFLWCFQWSDKLQKLEFQEMVMYLQHLPTQTWTHLDLETVLSRAYMWHTMFNSSPSHLAS